jgi:hypothetical protein
VSDVRLQCEAYTTNRFPAYVNREIRFRFVTNNNVEPVARITGGVRRRKSIAKINRDVPVVCMTHDGIAIAPFPTTQRTGC